MAAVFRVIPTRLTCGDLPLRARRRLVAGARRLRFSCAQGVPLTRFVLPTPRGGRREFWHRLGLLFGVSGIAGLLVAGVELPIVGGLGLAAKRGAEQFDSLPSELKAPPLPQRTRILAADGSVIAQFY